MMEKVFSQDEVIDRRFPSLLFGFYNDEKNMWRVPLPSSSLEIILGAEIFSGKFGRII
jgi:hypothetical protein